MQADIERQRAEANFHRSLEIVDSLLTQVGDERLRDVPQAELVRRKILEDAVSQYRRFQTENPDNLQVRLRLAIALRNLGKLYVTVGTSQEWTKAFQESEHLLKDLHREFPENDEYRFELATTTLDLSFHYGRTAWESLELANRSIELLRPLVKPEKIINIHHPERVPLLFANALRQQGEYLVHRGQSRLADNSFLEAIEYCDILSSAGNNMLATLYTYLADQAKRKANHTVAIDYFRKSISTRKEALRLSPNSGLIRSELSQDHLRLADYLNRTGQITQAREEGAHAYELAKILIQEFPMTRSYKQIIINASIGTNRKEDAKKLLDAYIPTSIGELLYRAKKYQVLGEYEKAKVDAVHAIEMQSIDPVIRYEMLEAIPIAGISSKEKLRLAKSWAEINPSSYFAWTMMGEAHSEMENQEESFKCWRKVDDLFHEGLGAATIARVYMEKGKWDEAERILIEALEKGRSGFHALTTYGQILIYRNKYHEAIDILTKAIALTPGGWIYKRRSAAHLLLHQYNEALEDLRRAVELNPEDSTNFNYILPISQLMACPQERFRQEIVRLADYAVEHASDNSKCQMNRAFISLELNDYARAMADLDQLSLQKIDRAYISSLRMLVYLVTGNQAKYQEESEKALKEVESVGDKAVNGSDLFWIVWGCSLGKEAIKDPDRIVKFARRLKEMEGPRQDTLMALGMALYRTGHFDEALSTLKQAETATPGKFAISQAYVGYFLSMVHGQLKNMKESQDYLQKARDQAKKELSPENKLYPSWSRRSTFSLLDQEASRLLDVSPLQKNPG